MNATTQAKPVRANGVTKGYDQGNCATIWLKLLLFNKKNALLELVTSCRWSEKNQWSMICSLWYFFDSPWFVPAFLVNPKSFPQGQLLKWSSYLRWIAWARVVTGVTGVMFNGWSLATAMGGGVVYTWNPNDLYFWRSTPQNKAFSNQNKGHLGSR